MPSPDTNPLELPRKRTIFIGSSHEGLVEAKQLCSALERCDSSLDPQLWTTFFEASALTFEALEEMLLQCCAAVFVVRPDDLVKHIDDPKKPLRMPRGNVLLEFGLVAGRIGRRNVAICRFGDADLPSDLESMTVINMKGISDAGEEMVGAETLAKLQQWTSHLRATAISIPRTAVFHGYTGRWEFEIRLSRWRGIVIETESYAVVSGTFYLLIPTEGLAGTGHAYANLAFRLEPLPGRDDPARELFVGDLQVTHELRNIDCDQNGGLQFTSHAFDIHLVDSTGKPWPGLSFSSSMQEPWTFKWDLAPNGRANELEGTLKTSASGGTDGKLTAKKQQFSC